MTETDFSVLASLHARAFKYADVERMTVFTLPSSATLIVRSDRRTGYSRFLAILLHAFRQGAVGAVLSYSECMTIAGVKSQKTWRRWCLEWEASGLVTIVQTWKKDPTGEHHRCHAKLFYRLGPAWAGIGELGLCENATAGTSTNPQWCARQAAGARRKARELMRKEADRMYAQFSRNPRFMKNDAISRRCTKTDAVQQVGVSLSPELRPVDDLEARPALEPVVSPAQDAPIQGNTPPTSTPSPAPSADSPKAKRLRLVEPPRHVEPPREAPPITAGAVRLDWLPATDEPQGEGNKNSTAPPDGFELVERMGSDFLAELRRREREGEP